MDSPEELAKLSKGLEQMRVRLLDLMHETADVEVRKQMQVAADRIQDGAIPFVKDYPKLKADVERRLQETKKSAEGTIAKAEELQRKLKEMEELAKQPPPAPPPESPLNPQLGLQLRDELLNLFGDRSDAGGAGISGSLWSALKQHK